MLLLEEEETLNCRQKPLKTSDEETDKNALKAAALNSFNSAS